MNKNYVNQENMEEMRQKGEFVSKKNEENEKNLNEGHVQDGQRFEDGFSMNSDREQQENDGRKYRDGIPMKDDREVPQQDDQKYVDGTSMKDEKENRQLNGESIPENQDEIYDQKARQEESPGNQGYRN